ncbi:MAG: hypothetical protein ACOYMG_01480 [Candidatus Methylumidiphilus sp.]
MEKAAGDPSGQRGRWLAGKIMMGAMPLLYLIRPIKQAHIIQPV